MQEAPYIENTVTNISVNQQFGVFYSLQFHKNNLQITYILVARKKIKSTDKI